MTDAIAPGYMPRSKSNGWRTPVEVLELLHVMWEGGAELDPCASSDAAHHFAKRNLTVDDDGLEEEWRGTTFVNPPFSDLADWAAKCASSPHAEVVLLLPARTDTRYWHEHVRKADAICFWRGRLTFVGAPSVAPFPVAFAYFGHRPWLFHAAFSPRGMVVRP